MNSTEGGAAAVIGGEGGAGGEAGAGAAGGGEQNGNGNGNGDAGAGGGGEQNGGAGGGAATWFDALSVDKPAADKLSDREWAENKHYKDVGELVRAHRGLEQQLGASGKIELPKEGDPQEKVDAFYTALGRPENAEGYVAPQLGDGMELDAGLFKSFSEKAFELGAPKGMAEGLAKWFTEVQADTLQSLVTERDQETDAKFTEWGGQKTENIATLNRGAEYLGLDKDAVADIQKGFGAGRTLDLLLKIGQGVREDVLSDVGNRQRFGVTGAQAKVELDRILADPKTTELVAAKDAGTIAKIERLEAAIAADMDREQRQQ